MALTFRILYRNSRYINDTIIPARWCYKTSNPVRILASGICYQKNTVVVKSLNRINEINSKAPLRSCTTQNYDAKPPTEPKKGLVQRFKEMYRDYWYVVLPVHMTTSAIWFGSFYYAVRSGVDVIGLLENLNISEKLLSPLKESSAGYFALAFALYKLITPLRYAVTVGGTTYAIKKLQTLGWIRPVPSRERIKEMIQEKKENLQGRIHESKQHYQSQMREKGSQVMEEMKRYKTEMHNIKNKVKKM
ncbi:PREDICTED: uncharacterized protein C18orf19 homolog A isoform X1 [Papilio xuthus]|uniref:Uncharacterized protein C18orf19 homolog A isoform X1 n=2 Tax=Papilio xuthus TaxID=66420 RepID=A0AAJ6ZA71_PAPXU|nr:PREDICTED: uncharacterized protein C18orf19 homolog A isoform X1 [Papilio xuthus]